MMQTNIGVFAKQIEPDDAIVLMNRFANITDIMLVNMGVNDYNQNPSNKV